MLSKLPIENWEGSQYELVDFGQGRKLERFGTWLMDRPCPAAEKASPRTPAAWATADVRLEAKGTVARGRPPKQWQVTFGEICFELRLTPFGHVGLFPEQALNWGWLAHQVRLRKGSGLETTALNLFAYTGGSTLALAAAGAHVTHVDASSPAVTWARKNALLSRMQQLPVRWIVEDARKFVAREIRREKQYDVIVLDPPTFGHGPSGKRWQIDRDLSPLLQECRDILHDRHSAIVLSAHCETPSMSQLGKRLTQLFPSHGHEADRLFLIDSAGRKLDAGFYVRASVAS